MRMLGADIFVGIHVRRTDMVKSIAYLFPPDNYFVDAMALFRQRLAGRGALMFLVASDDPAWCLQQAMFQGSDVYVLPKDKVVGHPPFEPATSLRCALLSECPGR